MTKKIITVAAEIFSPSDLDGSTLEAAKTRMEAYISLYGANAKLNWDPHYCHPSDSVPSPRYEIHITREETDAEHDKRIEVAIANKAARDIRDRKEYERLSTIFGTQK